ncbi:formate--tetrahydrofolate ligase [Loigolactobacillus coryniformis]|uniref:Formate--tetrahydrofolate ligase n=1 Tax=Loigolactobacillus coryniformis subsp. torquens DSM 20004 = KCTC 3535 TaxID=1423822 RepID=A0A2D1KP29_9LACO|nr:formate--tetrahydrofolate ligase [Loigolactobacillus coryniformis]MDT3392644.1 formate--tetrahydrofolate ligase [Bacillota bacterium]RRG06584.1 MAG: formate--tetrahydrofolate ligase [Lactobacillus sp.]ATO43851.1 formate--tetrahydrofolate ligase [Loigolactobacillus coryniformis subsp. torquens DSM 20004 = KCTC 3535]MCL5458177.1 formate--tetrahydrofolate ligase [Loigolactobacillus coryniformis]MDN5950791.1 formate--tetrahydrofolate ligase [Loigolactobacillus coryniformis]
MSDIEIAQQNEQSEIKPIQTIAKQIGLDQHDIEQYGEYKAKVKLTALDQRSLPKDHKLILVTSINPTPAGEGKSTVTIGLGDAMNRLNKQTIIALREPSLGPVMGIKGGATGGGYAQVVPMEDINLHFTGDMHALTSANNTLAALIDNHIQQGNELHIDQRRITWKRALDINDRALRNVVIGLGGPFQGVPREDGFNITVASELMAILCLATSITDLKARIARIVIGYTDQKQPVTVADLKVQGAITMLLKDALKPNLVQTLEHTPTFVHGGPFANIAHGCNSVLATTAALKLADYTITEAGFGADLGAEKFLDIKVPQLGKHPDAIVLVATIRALKYNGGVALADLQTENVAALTAGFVNLKRHIKNMQQYGLPVTVAINHFVSDTAAEVTALQELCAELGVKAIDTEVWANGGAGGIDLANAVLASLAQPATFNPLYDNQASITEKVTTIVQKIYGGDAVEFSTKAQRQMQTFITNGWDKLPICMAKTQYSFSDEPKQLGAPTGFKIHIREFVPDLGAGFLVALTGNVLTMPGLPKKPAALNMDIAEDGTITGLF